MTSPLWAAVDHPLDLETMTDQLRCLELLLVEERAAIARIDAAALDDCGARKQLVVASIRALIAEPRHTGGDAERIDETRRVAVRALAHRVAGAAAANAALLHDAVRAASSALGIEPETNTDDWRARRITTRGGMVSRPL